MGRLLCVSLCSLHNFIVLFLCPDTGFGTIFTSDDRGIVYSKSLDRHLYTTTGGETDFTNVTSLRGVYMTSVLSEGEARHSHPSAKPIGRGCFWGDWASPPVLLLA